MKKYNYNTFLLFFICILFASFQEIEAQVTDTVKVEESFSNENDQYTDEDSTEAAEENYFDTSLVVSQWIYPTDSFNYIKNQKGFHYISTLDSLLKAKQDEELKKEASSELNQQKPVSSIFPVVRFLLWAIAIFAIFFIIYRLFLSEKRMFISPTKNKKLKLADDDVVQEEFLEKQLKGAIQKSDYRSAIRFLYLMSLNKLAEKGWVQLSPDKTNYQYVQEVKKNSLKNEFARITLHYEYAWYGDFRIEESVFNLVKEDFDRFYDKLKKA